MRRVIAPLLALIVACAAVADDAAPSDLEGARLDVAVERGLDALVRLQAADGTFCDEPGVTAIAGLALLAHGDMPTRGPRHVATARTLTAILAAQDGFTGLIPGRGGYLYSHGFATLFLCECAGMSDVALGWPIDAAIDVLLQAQHDGGWRYVSPIDADVSVTICAAAALRAAHDIARGGHPLEEAMSAAVAYVRARERGDGSFAYRADDHVAEETRPVRGVPRAAAGALTLLCAGIATDDAGLARSLSYLRRYLPDHLRERGPFFWYGQYYAAQALRRSPRAEDWAAYRALAYPAILALQGDDGAWTGPDTDEAAAYNTAMALLVLQIEKDYLPAFQR